MICGHNQDILLKWSVLKSFSVCIKSVNTTATMLILVPMDSENYRLDNGLHKKLKISDNLDNHHARLMEFST